MTTTGNNLPVDTTNDANVQDPADWVADTRVIPPELDDEYEAATYPPKPIHFVPLKQKLTGNEWAALKAYAQQATIGEPDASA